MDLDPLSLGTSAVSAGVGVVKTINAMKQEKKDRAALERAEKEAPEYKIMPEFEQNRNITANIASQGMPSATKNFFTSIAERGLSASIGASQQAGGGVNGLSELLDQYNTSLERTAAADANMRISGITSFIDANSALAGQRLIKEFAVPNERWRNKVAGLNRSIAGDQQSVTNGISDITGSLASFVASNADRTGGGGGGNKGGSGGGTAAPASGYVPSSPFEIN